jgi:hypothetical protein
MKVIFEKLHPIFINYSVQVLSVFSIGIVTAGLRKQRRSICLTKVEDEEKFDQKKGHLDAMYMVEELMITIYQMGFFAVGYILTKKDSFKFVEI